MKHKSKAFVILKNVKALVGKEIGYVIKALRSNRGGKFTSKEFNEFCEKKMRFNPTIKWGRREKKNKTILNIARCMLKVKSMPKEFCAEVVSCAIYLSNRFPIRNVKGGLKPKVDHLRVFWSIAYAHVPNKGRSMLDDRNVKHVFIGYDANSKGYKLYNPNNGQMIVSKDVELLKKRHEIGRKKKTLMIFFHISKKVIKKL
ncbi:hypothetical protein CR513_38115, partial [Mucuna pruriens]